MTNPPRTMIGAWPVSRLLVILAVVFFILAALLAGSVIAGSGLSWLVDAGLASFALAFLVPLCPGPYSARVVATVQH